VATTPAPSLIESRRDQVFPVLLPAEVDRLRRFGALRRYRDGEMLFEAGKTGPGMFVIASGRVAVTRHSGLGQAVPLVEQGPGQFLAEVGQLSGRPAMADGQAIGDVEALLIPPDGLRALLVAEAELGERIMRALILRRVSMIETGAGGPVLVGPAGSSDMVRLRGFLSRNGHPHQVLDCSTDETAAALVQRYAPRREDLPLAVCPDGSVLRNPSEAALARCLGILAEPSPDKVYDVAIVGAGPAGLATAVYAASEGLSVLVIDARAFGGQAGASARIENYLGFPTGISGQALAGRAFVQAQKFGAEFLIPAEIARLDCRRDGGEGPLQLELADGRRLGARAVVIASGARYRRPAIANLATFEGRGVSYWASPIEAKMCAGAEVVVVGGGNSAGQGAVYLSGHARQVWMLVRAPNLAASMSRYLIDRIGAAANITLLTETELVELIGSRDVGLERVRWRHRPPDTTQDRPIRDVFLFVGADPATEWLDGCGVVLDDKGFVKTGASLPPEELTCRATVAAPAPLPLETNRPGVFAVGDVRSGSVKRVGGAIGEGAAVVAQLHAFLAA
jgi:thioredoxin reductase (NADPH)